MIIERMFSFKGRTKDTQVEGEKPTPFSLNSQRFYIPSLMLFTNTRKKGEEKKKRCSKITARKHTVNSSLLAARFQIIFKKQILTVM